MMFLIQFGRNATWLKLVCSAGRFFLLGGVSYHHLGNNGFPDSFVRHIHQRISKQYT